MGNRVVESRKMSVPFVFSFSSNPITEKNPIAKGHWKNLNWYCCFFSFWLVNEQEKLLVLIHRDCTRLELVLWYCFQSYLARRLAPLMISNLEYHFSNNRQHHLQIIRSITVIDQPIDSKVKCFFSVFGFTLTFSCALLTDKGCSWSINGAEVDETDDVRIRFSPSSSSSLFCFFKGIWGYIRCGLPWEMSSDRARLYFGWNPYFRRDWTWLRIG